MTSKLKCPFCQQELEQMHDKKLLGCPKCLHIADGAFWAKAIQAKQDLEIAKSYVKGISQMVINSGDNIYVVIGHFKELAEQTLTQIEHKEQI